MIVPYTVCCYFWTHLLRADCSFNYFLPYTCFTGLQSTAEGADRAGCWGCSQWQCGISLLLHPEVCCGKSYTRNGQEISYSKCSPWTFTYFNCYSKNLLNCQGKTGWDTLNQRFEVVNFGQPFFALCLIPPCFVLLTLCTCIKLKPQSWFLFLVCDSVSFSFQLP